ncbi:GGDEF domain-containing protein [Neptunicella sp. SCSIO 80796]|uniref:GGDEF domain-containing protein n=1 Tax=Neptunicella plasticusilytica TaxID=3117012 RepID=UPI003A4D52D8
MHLSADKRGTEETIILSLSAASFFCLLPFCVMRLLSNDWTIALLDIFAVCAMAAIYLYVYRTRETRIAGWALLAFYLLVLFCTIYLKGSAQLVWVYPVIVALFFVLTPKIGVLFALILLLALLPVIFRETQLVAASAFYISAIATTVFSFVFASKTREQRNQLIALSVSDPLTGVGNRRALDDKLREVVRSQTRTQRPVSMLLFDLDRFKAINDQFGHAEGDKILVKLVQVILKRIRAADSLYRFGGEEFVIVTDNTALDAAAQLAENIRGDIEQSCLSEHYPITVSLGIAQYQPGETGYDWLGRADKAMYQAKNAGRNASCVAPAS